MRQNEQYSLAKILGIWASAALPVGLIMWVIVPLLIPHANMEPGFLFLILITLGLVWQGVVAYLLLRQEVKPFTWQTSKTDCRYIAPPIPRQLLHRIDRTSGPSR